MTTQSADILITHLHLISMAGDSIGYIPDGAVAIKGQHIVGVGASDKLVARFNSAETINGTPASDRFRKPTI